MQKPGCERTGLVEFFQPEAVFLAGDIKTVNYSRLFYELPVLCRYKIYNELNKQIINYILTFISKRWVNLILRMFMNEAVHFESNRFRI